MHWDGEETVADFGSAWRLCARRRGGGEVPRRFRRVAALLFDQLSLLGSQFGRALRVFPLVQVYWWYCGDCSRGPRRAYAEVLEFLGRPDDGRWDFPRVNARKDAGVGWLSRMTEKTFASLVERAFAIKQPRSIEDRGVLDILPGLNMTSVGHKPREEAQLWEIRAHFNEDVWSLERITGRNLACWPAGAT